MNKNGQFLHFIVFCFFTGCFYQSCVSGWPPVFNFLQFYTTLLTSLWQFVKKFDNLSSAFQCSYDIESTVYYSFSGHWNLSEIHPPEHTVIPTHCYLRLRTRFLPHTFSKNSKFCCSSNVNNYSQLIYPYLL